MVMKNSFGAAGDDFASPPQTGMKREAMSRSRVVRPAAGGKDRHSKVCTARGTRDRRVRLSPKTAILFYDVQDRLGYDRPSKAIDWLINEAKSAIDELQLHDPNHHSSYAPPLHSKNDANLFSALDAISEAGEGLFDANSETSRLQRFFGEDYADHHMFLQSQSQSQREPLQSSFSGINTINSPQFHGGNFSYSLHSFSAEDEMDYVPLLSKPSSSSSPISFLDYKE